MDDRDALRDMTIPQLLRWRVQRSPEGVALREKEFGCWNNHDLGPLLRAGPHARPSAWSRPGSQPGDTFAVISDNIPEMLVMAVGAQAAGAVSAGIYQSSLPDEIAAILDYMDVRYVFCDDQEQVDKLIEVRDRIPKVRRVFYEDPRGMRAYRSDDWFMFLDELLALGERAVAADPGRFDRLIDRGRPDDVCHFCLTSGTTGLPKGAMMTHRNYINMGVQLTKVDPLQEGDEYVSFLPFAWIGEQMNSFGVALATGMHGQFPGVGRDRHGGPLRDRPALHVRRPAHLRNAAFADLAEDRRLLLAEPGALRVFHEGRRAGGGLPHVGPADAARPARSSPGSGKRWSSGR